MRTIEKIPNPNQQENNSGPKKHTLNVCTGRGRALRSQLGIGTLTLFVFGTLTAAALFAAYHIIPFYYYYYELVNQMEAVIRVADMENDASIRRKLLYHINKMELPVDEKDLKIVREDRHMRIELTYEEVFYISFKGKDYDIHRFPFHASAEGDF